ncbi:hypothetical protein [Bradyrhizobium lablabi]|uniref:hypothetical protein n=1 Tax=Bradyrhizobium lablabi TaxID=722472 RepID=UPI00201157BB|nr:hypothetical protein [Bradyrhizobium lablabi]
MKTTLGRQANSTNAFKLIGFAIIGLAGIAVTSKPASALNMGAAASFGSRAIIDHQNSDIIDVRAVARRGGVAVGPRGNAVGYRSRTVVRGPVGRPGVRAGWARPGWYRWPVGGAIAAGAAVGFVTAASAAAWAGAAPAAGMCWFYTDPSRTQGFWDYCPQ